TRMGTMAKTSSSVTATVDRCWVDAGTSRHLDGSNTPRIATSPGMGATGLPATAGLSAISSVDGTATDGVGATTSRVANTTLPVDACIASSSQWITGFSVTCSGIGGCCQRPRLPCPWFRREWPPSWWRRREWPKLPQPAGVRLAVSEFVYGLCMDFIMDVI
ncbi:hypothetical protein ACJX0J_042178, partial [Zea mays]